MAILFATTETITAVAPAIGGLDVGGRTLSVFALRTADFAGQIELQGRINANSAWHRVEYWIRDPDSILRTGPFIAPIVPPASGEMHYLVYGPWRSLRVSKTQGGGTIEVDHFASPLDPNYLFAGAPASAGATEVTQGDPDSLQIAANIKVGLEDVDDLNPVPVTGNVGLDSSLPSGDNHIGQIGADALSATMTITLPAAGDYAAGDVLAQSATAGVAIRFGGLTRKPGVSFYVSKALLTTSVAAFATGVRLWLFSRPPSASTINDNVALSIAAADKPFLKGVITLSGAINAGGFSLLENDYDRKLVVPDPADGGLYVVAQAISAEVGEAASMTMDITLTVERN